MIFWNEKYSFIQNVIVCCYGNIGGNLISRDVGQDGESETTEYCWQQFNASCSSRNQVILMQGARYGRMRLGRCLTRDYYIGCSADVISHVDKRCSGRRSCEISVPDTEFQQLQPCPKDLMAYLEADYNCITGTWNNLLQILETMHYRYLKQCITGTWNNALQVLETMHYRYLKQYITGTWNNAL